MMVVVCARVSVCFTCIGVSAFLVLVQRLMQFTFHCHRGSDFVPTDRVDAVSLFLIEAKF